MMRLNRLIILILPLVLAACGEGTATAFTTTHVAASTRHTCEWVNDSAIRCLDNRDIGQLALNLD